MSDIGIPFPLWFTAALALFLALPVTTAIMAGLGIAWYRLRRRDPAQRLTGLKWAAITVAPLWFIGLVFGGGMLISELHRLHEGAQRYFSLDKAAEIDGVTLPAGTRVELDEDRALQAAELPGGATLALHRATWQGRVEFLMPARAPNGAHGQVTEGTLAAPAVIQGIPCQAGQQVQFFWDNELMACTLSQDASVPATIADPKETTHAQMFRCLSGDTIQIEGLRHGELAGCRLAEPADFGEITCAASERILLANGGLSTCVLAKPGGFGPLTLPAGTAVTYYDARPSGFRLPPSSAAIDGFGLSLPAGTEGSFCYPGEALAHLAVSQTAYVTVESIKLTGWIDFDCGSFRSGTLFDDTMINGRWRQRGELVSSTDLVPQKSG